MLQGISWLRNPRRDADGWNTLLRVGAFRRGPLERVCRNGDKGTTPEAVGREQVFLHKDPITCAVGMR